MKVVRGVLYVCDGQPFFMSDSEQLVYAWSFKDKCWKWSVYKPSRMTEALMLSRGKLNISKISFVGKVSVNHRLLCSGIKFDFFKEWR